MGLREKWLRAHSQDAQPTSGDDLLSHFETREYLLGEHIFAAGDPAHELYEILSGTVLVYHESEHGPITLAELHASDFLGEMGCLQGEPRSFSAMATATTRVLVVPEAVVDATVAHLPRWFLSVIDTLINRLRETDKRLVTHVANEADDVLVK